MQRTAAHTSAFDQGGGREKDKGAEPNSHHLAWEAWQFVIPIALSQHTWPCAIMRIVPQRTQPSGTPASSGLLTLGAPPSVCPGYKASFDTLITIPLGQ